VDEDATLKDDEITTEGGSGWGDGEGDDADMDDMDGTDADSTDADSDATDAG
jgi:hypothetical protein